MKRTILACIFLLLMLCACFSGCSLSFGDWGSYYQYDDFEEYTMGGAELSESVNAIVLDWIDGNVTVAYHDEATVVFSETTDAKLDETTSLYYWLDNGTLFLRYAKSGIFAHLNFQKDLTVYLPKESALSSLELLSVSSDLELEQISASSIKLTTVSGDMDLRSCSFGQVRIQSVSGGGKVSLTGETDQLEIETVSGDIQSELAVLSRLNVETVSGEITVSANTAPLQAEISSVSGDVCLYLPEDAGFVLEVETVSGDVMTELPATQDKDRYTFGNGEGTCSFSSVSGDLVLKKKRGSGTEL